MFIVVLFKQSNLEKLKKKKVFSNNKMRVNFKLYCEKHKDIYLCNTINIDLIVPAMQISLGFL